MDEALHLAVIVGSTRPGRLGPTVARWFVDRARARDDVRVDVIDLVEALLDRLDWWGRALRAARRPRPYAA